MSALRYYVYYKMDPARIESVRASVEALLSEVRAQTGVQGDWQRRRDDPGTFMETYTGVTDAAAFEQALNLALQTSGFDRLGIARITEIFQCA